MAKSTTMAPMSKGKKPKPSQIVKPTISSKHRTASHRNHVFESFNTRIAKLKIAPLRSSSSRPDLDTASNDLTSASSSYFATGLAEWSDRNLASVFTAFAEAVAPLAESLPMVIHHAERIFALFEEALKTADRYALEPLCALLSSFAHDLGGGFESFFPRAFGVVAEVATRATQEVECIEWCFGAEAWLVKYMSRVLLEDGETAKEWWGEVGRWLGRERQKPFVVRFMGEVVGFLLRRAAKDEARLRRVLTWLVRDFLSTEEPGLYAEGLKVAVSEAVKGVSRGVHSAGVLVLTELIRFAYGQDDAGRARIFNTVIQGAIISVVHFTDQQGFGPIEVALLDLIENGVSTEEHVIIAASLLSVIASTRKGTRISDWTRVTKATSRLVDQATSLGVSKQSELPESVLRALGNVFSAAPVHTAVKHTSTLEKISRDPWTAHFLPLCYFLAELSPDRFKTLLLKPFQQFIVDNWQDMEQTMLAVITRLHSMQAFDVTDLRCPKKWSDHMVATFKDSRSVTRLEAAKKNSYLKLLESTKEESANTRETIASALWSLLASSSNSSAINGDSADLSFMHGQGFYFAASTTTPSHPLESILQPASSDTSLLLYWQALATWLEKPSSSFQEADTAFFDSIFASALRQLRSPSHELRATAIQVLEEIYKLQSKTWPEICETISLIENTPATVQSARAISSQIRRLALLYKQTSEDDAVCQMVVSYCFGLLHFRLAQAWDDATEVLKEISSYERAEAILLDIVSEWLNGGSEPLESQVCDWTPHAPQATRSDFECLNVNQVTAHFSNSLEACTDPSTKLEAIFDQDHQQISLLHPFNRIQALKVLKAVPQLVERRSRLLVPVLLNWASRDVQDITEGEADTQRWTRKDQKAMLDVFAQFQNPKVLYKSGEVWSALLELIANGDVEIQRSALKALLSWKESRITRYEQHLFNFLDEARFREEITVFLKIGEEEGIRADDLPTLAPVLLRLIYGRLVNRSGNASGVRGKESKRNLVFGALAEFPDMLQQFIDIALEPFGFSDIRGAVSTEVHPRKQVGALNMLNNMLELGDRLKPFAIRMGDVALTCLLGATKSRIDTDESIPDSDASLLKVVRQAGFKCLTRLIECCPELDWSRHAESVVSNLLVPRFDNFAAEFAQSLSAVLRLLSVWSLYPNTALYLVEFSQRIIPELASCVTAEYAKPEVKKFVIDEIFGKLLEHHDGSSSADNMDVDNATSVQAEVTRKVLRPNAGVILRAISEMLKKSPAKELLDSGVACVANLAGLIDQKDVAKDFVQIATFLLKQPNAKVAYYTKPHTKQKLLSAIQHLIPASGLDTDDELSMTVYEAMTPLFAMMPDRDGRQQLCGVLASLATSIKELARVAELCDDLNSFALGKINEPDFERRSKAFRNINEELYLSLSPVQWQAVLHNMLFYIQDNEEVAIRASASYSLQRFLAAAVEGDVFKSDKFEELTTKVLYPGLRSGMRNPSELVRIEYMAVMSTLVHRMSFWTPVADMVPLLQNNDEEASVFLNILHVQQHRRLRALKRLVAQAESGGLSSSNVASVFWPLIEHFIFDAAQDESAHNLTAEAVTTLGALTVCLEWTQYKAILGRYIAMMKKERKEKQEGKEGNEKTIIRLVGSVVDGLYKVYAPKQPVDGEDQDMKDAKVSSTKCILVKTLPKSEENFASTVTEQFLPPLANYLHLKDDTDVSLRVPVGVVIVKLIKCLPENLIIIKLPSVLLDLCHILRSRDQGSRDNTRKTLAVITALLGPKYFNFILKELRSALQRGYQLHVLSFTVHSIMVENLQSLQPGDLDHCIPELTAIIMDDIFGVAGQEKEAEDYISKMKEVKSSKSFDSMELLAKITTLDHLSQLVKPIRSLLQEKLDLRTVKKIDELLRRLEKGVTSNSAVIDRSILVFCFEIITLVNEVKKPVAQNGKPFFNDYKTRRYIIQMHSAQKSGKKGVTSSYTFKLVRFALDLLRSVLQKHDDLKTPQNISGFVPVISEALVSGQEEVQLSVIRLLTGIMRVPLPELESNASVYVSEAVKVIKAAQSMTNESAQAALKLISSALRDRSSTKIREIDLAYVLKRLKPDLEQPDRQGVIFNFLKSVVGRKIVITEVYEIMDAVAAIMVTNQTRQARELARGIYFQFMMDYPQGKDRLNKQIAFLVKNLEYAYPEGRQSVLELLHLLLQKTKGEITQNVSSMTFVPLVMMLANDDSPDCREMAGALIKQILEKAEDENRKTYTSLLHQWIEQEDQALIRRLAMQIWKMQTEVGGLSAKETDFLVRHVETILPNGEDMIAQAEWEPLYYALQLFAEIAKVSPDVAFSTKRNSLWNGVYRGLTFPHTWVKLSASRLIGLLFGDVGKTHKDIGMDQIPLHASNGLQLADTDLRRLCSSFLRVLRHQGSSEQLLAQTCRNIVFLGRVFGASGLEWPSQVPNGTNGETDGEVSEQDENDDTASIAGEESASSQPAALYLLKSLSSILRHSPSSTNPSTLPPRLAALQVQQSLLSTLSPSLYISILPTILHPLLVQTDPSIPKPVSHKPGFEENQARLTTMAREALSAIQDKVGGGRYVEAVTAAQQGIRQAREERRVKRRIERVADPEAYERRKERKVWAAGYWFGGNGPAGSAAAKRRRASRLRGGFQNIEFTRLQVRAKQISFRRRVRMSCPVKRKAESVPRCLAKTLTTYLIWYPDILPEPSVHEGRLLSGIYHCREKENAASLEAVRESIIPPITAASKWTVSGAYHLLRPSRLPGPTDFHKQPQQEWNSDPGLTDLFVGSSWL
ncbi:hypothetical protein K461DRAFT_313332 [Myriangium duriaei CBS 260.36]|uniref:Uncharacterized protein n=1 Tax=Myriangium duriaei CBS 260.36 TaxID=1168546 RepID=A0A9P4J5D1_9PEZI|nr:hypothetical protein K461DRAFT_313332 [Myriangium duriaei CBS 260.36]